jgi:L-alanine-DL-glutamate epimerase-like enolase superfamily enzyme
VPEQLTIRSVAVEHKRLNTSQLSTIGRKSLVVRLETDFGPVFGEASPLFGYGDDCFERAEEDLHSLRAGTLMDALAELLACDAPSEQRNESLPESPSVQKTLLAIVERVAARCTSPSARFCVEMLLLNALARAWARPVGALLRAGVQARTLRTSAVIDPASHELRAEIQLLIARGVTTFKLKCGQNSTRELTALAELSSLSTPEQKLRIRLDPNGAWEDEDLRPFVDATRSLRLEWIEDLSAQPLDWPRIREAHPDLPLAIDECLLRAQPNVEILKLSGAAVVVLKPMALGGFSKAIEWAHRADELNLTICVSHFFDGPIAFDATAQLAFAIQSEGFVPGLGRHVALTGWSAEFGSPQSLSGDLLRPDGSSFGS